MLSKICISYGTFFCFLMGNPYKLIAIWNV